MKHPLPDYPIIQVEERTIKRIGFSNVFLDFVNAFNIERGLIYTIKLMFSNPGLMIRSFLGEGRFKIFNVFRLLLLSTAISLLIFYLTGIDSFFKTVSEGLSMEDDVSGTSVEQMQLIFVDWYNLFLWIAIPVYALFTFLLNLKSGYNFAEHLVTQAYYLSAINLIYLVIAPFSMLLPGSQVLVISLVLSILYYIWMLSSWLQTKSFLFFLKAIFSFVISNIIYPLLIMFLVSIFV